MCTSRYWQSWSGYKIRLALFPPSSRSQEAFWFQSRQLKSSCSEPQIRYLWLRGTESWTHNNWELRVWHTILKRYLTAWLGPRLSHKFIFILTSWPSDLDRWQFFLNMIPTFISWQSVEIQTITLLITTCLRPPSTFSYPDPFAAPPPLLPSPSFGIVGPPHGSTLLFKIWI